jgi:hypothetical protein
MYKFVKYKLKDGRQIRCRCNHDSNKVLISLDDFEGLLNESDVAYEQAKQLQTIIENLQEIKIEVVRKALDEIRAEIGKSKIEHEMQIAEKDTGARLLISDIYCDIVNILDKYKEESDHENENSN